MNAFSPDVIERLGWVLIHSLWQFTVLTVLAAVIAAVLRRRSAAMRDGVAVIGMSLMVVAPYVTWIFVSATPMASSLG